MRVFQSSVFRALCAIIVGALLIKFPDNTVRSITVAIGLLFLLSGVISCVTYFWTKRHTTEYKIYDADGRLIAGERPAFPIVGVGSIILGAILALMPATFVSLLMYVIGAILILGAVNQFMSLVNGRRYGRISLWYWVMPSFILLIGLYAIVKPMEQLSMAMLLLGWCMLLYGITELINALKFYQNKKKLQQEQSQLDTFQEIKDEEFS